MAAQAGGVVYNSQQNAQKVASQALQGMKQEVKQEARLSTESVKQQFGMQAPEQQASQPQGVDIAALKAQEQARMQELRNILAGMRGINAEMAQASQQREQQNQAWQQDQAEKMQAAQPAEQQAAAAAQEQFTPQAVKAKQGSREMGKAKG